MVSGILPEAKRQPDLQLVTSLARILILKQLSAFHQISDSVLIGGFISTIIVCWQQ